MTLPTLSVLLPNYNHADFVGSALKAILAQSVQPTEIIVIDDASTDNSVEVIKGFARRHAHIRFLRNETNRGVNGTLNRALGEARCEYIYGAAADDQVLPGFFERSLKLLAKHPQAALCTSYPSRVDAITGVITQHALNWSGRECFLPPARLARVMRGNAVPGHSTIARRDLMVEVGGWAPELQWFTDWFALQVIAFRRGACFIPATLALFRSSLASYYSTGIRNREKQALAVEHLFRRLAAPEYRDVLPCFRSSGVLHEIGLDAVRALAANPALLTAELKGLMQRPIIRGARRLLRDSDPKLRLGMAKLLGDIGPGAFLALPPLVAASRHPEPLVREAAESATKRVLGPFDSLAGGVPGRALKGSIEIAIHAQRIAKAWLKPPVAWLYRQINQKLYGHLDQFEASLHACGRSFDEERHRMWDDLKAIRQSLKEPEIPSSTRAA